MWINIRSCWIRLFAVFNFIPETNGIRVTTVTRASQMSRDLLLITIIPMSDLLQWKLTSKKQSGEGMILTLSLGQLPVACRTDSELLMNVFQTENFPTKQNCYANRSYSLTHYSVQIFNSLYLKAVDPCILKLRGRLFSCMYKKTLAFTYISTKMYCIALFQECIVSSASSGESHASLYKHI